MMSKLTFSFILFCCISILPLTSYAQMIVEGNQWNIAIDPMFSADTSSYSIRIGSDTTINGTVYKKVLRSIHVENQWTQTNQYIREENQSKIFLKDGNLDEKLIYDFSLNINDTFQMNDDCTWMVEEIDFVTLNNGESRKRLKLVKKEDDNWGYHYWIEGIGSNLGLLTIEGFCYTDYNERFLCFYTNQELIFPSNPSTCFITVNNIEVDDKISIYPNPVTETLIIEDTRNHLKAFQILDITGQNIQEGSLHMGVNTIYMNTRKPGIYILLTESQSGDIFTRKIVKH